MLFWAFCFLACHIVILLSCHLVILSSYHLVIICWQWWWWYDMIFISCSLFLLLIKAKNGNSRKSSKFLFLLGCTAPDIPQKTERKTGWCKTRLFHASKYSSFTFAVAVHFSPFHLVTLTPCQLCPCILVTLLPCYLVTQQEKGYGVWRRRILSLVEVTLLPCHRVCSLTTFLASTDNNIACDCIYLDAALVGLEV